MTPVTIMVAPSNYHSLKALYSQIPGVIIQPFRLRPRDLNVGSMLSLMSVDQSQSAPLYMGQVLMILRDMASRSPKGFDFFEFKNRLGLSKFLKGQMGPLAQRIQLLESFLVLDNLAEACDFDVGGITIIDLSCPFVDANMACILFNISMGLYLELDSTAGKIVAVDEAHKVGFDPGRVPSISRADSEIVHDRHGRRKGLDRVAPQRDPAATPLRRPGDHLHSGTHHIAAAD